jgi:4-amino-4-deoxy-L-arabinose transferase-like glycosyltransferase
MGKLRFVALAVIVVVGFIRVWVGRYSMNPDGVCYLDLGDAFFHRKWLDAVNGYWSLLYSWLLGAALFVTKPSRWWEFPVAHAVNFIIYLAALLCFEFFLLSLTEERNSELGHNGEHTAGLSEQSLFALGYALFLWSSLELITIWGLTPDLCVAALVYLIAGLLLRIRRRSSPRLCVILGIVLGLAYLTKAVMFPLGFAFILTGLLAVPRGKKLGYLLSVTLCFLAVSAPWLVALSRAKGRFTFGDSGRLNYSALVSPGGRLLNWQGQPPGSGVPVHTTRIIHENPTVYEFASPIGGTYPPSYDPSYWNEGRKWTLDARTQLRMIKQHLLIYAELLLRDQPGLLAGALTLVLVGRIATRKAVLGSWPLFAMCFAAMALYMLVHVETRFVGAYACLFWTAIIFGVRLSNTEDQRKMAENLVLAVVFTILLSVSDGILHAVRVGGPYSALDQVVVADGLEKMGLQAGDRVAVVGDGNWSYWARCGKFKIVTSADAPPFWAATPKQRNEVYRAFAGTGAIAVVAKESLAIDSGDGWRRIGASEYYARQLSH